MKKLVISIYCILISVVAYAQKDTSSNRFKKELDVNYNWSHIGRNLSINYNQYIGRHAFIIGVKQHYNSVITDNQGYAFRNRGYANNFGESIGLNIGYKYDLLKQHDYLMPYIFFQSQLSNISYKYIGDEIIYSPNGNYIHSYSEVVGPFFTTENFIGFGLKIRLYKNLFLNQTAAVGLTTIESKEPYILRGKKRSYHIDGATSIKLGLIYQFSK